MALVKCKECGHEISKSAKACPQCGAEIKHTSLLTWIVAIFFGFAFISAFIGVFTGSNVEEQKRARETGRDATERARLATLTPEQRASAEQKRVEEDAARKEREAQRLGLRWRYEETPDQMGRGNVKTAAIRSVNEMQLNFPDQGVQRAGLQLRIHPKYGKNVILSIERSQFLCGIDGCHVTVRFDQGAPQTHTALGSGDHSTTVLFIRNYDRFLANLRKSRKVYIEAQFYQEGVRVFEFDVAGRKW